MKNRLQLSISLAFIVLTMLAVSGCAVVSRDTPASDDAAVTGMSAGVIGSAPTAGITRPVGPSFATPREAVISYLAWVTFAYEMANSDVASMTFTPAEEVRVNSYVQLNKEKGQRIRQRLVEFAPGRQSVIGTTTLLPAREKWEYQYLELTAARSVSPTHTVAYETTYTLIPRDAGGWLVDSVEARALGEVK